MDMLIGIMIGSFGTLWSVLLLWVYLDNWMYKRELMRSLDLELDKFICGLKKKIESEVEVIKDMANKMDERMVGGR